MRCAHFFGWSLRLGMPSNSPCEVDFIFLFMVIYRDYTLLIQEQLQVVAPGEMLGNLASIHDADYLPLVIYH